jgi:predicted phosphoribosyltransferase
VVVLGLARGGVPVAWEVAAALGTPLDAFVVRKLGAPGHEEFAMGALASGGRVVVNDDVVRALQVTPQQLRDVAEREGRELLRREAAYRGDRAPLPLTGKTVILVDDGLATGASMFAAVQALREADPAEIVVAVPAAPESTRSSCAAYSLLAFPKAFASLANRMIGAAGCLPGHLHHHGADRAVSDLRGMAARVISGARQRVSRHQGPPACGLTHKGPGSIRGAKSTPVAWSRSRR